MSLLTAAAPVVDIDGTLWIQGGLFLLLVFVLRPLLFEPWLRTMDRRKTSIEGAHDEADTLRKNAESVLARRDERLAAVREQAGQGRAKARREAESEEATTVASARADAERFLNVERSRIEDEAAQAAGDLAGRAGDLARTIAHRVVGRAVS